MRNKILISIFLLVIINAGGFSQQNLSVIGRDLEGMFNRLRENISSEQKLKINDSITVLIDKYASLDSVFRHKFTNLRFLGQITSPDSLVKIINWNLILENGDNRFSCYFIRKNGTGESNKVYKLNGTYSEAPVRTDTIYSESDWYGALYYDIRPYAAGKETSYLLLGINYGNSFITRKLIDVLTFGPGDNLTFGKKCFVDGKVVKTRIVFEYSSTAVMSLRFYTDKSIVFDHLSPRAPEYKENHQFWGPDFTFDSYNLEDGLWKLTPNVDVRIEKNK